MAKTSGGAHAADTSTTPGSGGFLDSYFKISQRGSSVGQEIRGGLATFFTMAYIVVLNPIIIGERRRGPFLGSVCLARAMSSVPRS